ncbi:MAG: hypothetical protein M1546_17985 [Chloroflexi bacterium]|nr:hypothetical protein [Chloroflexota bacterium]
MKRPIAMIVAGMVTTLSMIGGTVAAVQTGVFSPSTTVIQAGGEIDVPAAVSPAEQPQVSTGTPTAEVDEDATSAPIGTPQTTAQPNISNEALLLAKLNEAYRIMKERDDAYQARLKEAFDKLKASPSTISRPSTAVQVRNTQPQPTNTRTSTPANTPVPAPTAPTGGEHETEHETEYQEEEHKEEEHESEDQHQEEDRHEDDGGDQHEDGDD